MSNSKKPIFQKALIALHVVAGVYAGACLSIAAVDLRYILSLEDPLKLQEVLSPLLQNMGFLMAPQLLVMLILCLVFSTKAFKLKKPIKTHTPLFFFLGILAITLAVHIPINKDVISGAIQNEDLMRAAKSWDTWHWIRTVLSLALPMTVMKFYRPLAR